jgi:hypothetical protein
MQPATTRPRPPGRGRAGSAIDKPACDCGVRDLDRPRLWRRRNPRRSAARSWTLIGRAAERGSPLRSVRVPAAEACVPCARPDLPTTAYAEQRCWKDGREIAHAEERRLFLNARWLRQCPYRRAKGLDTESRCQAGPAVVTGLSRESQTLRECQGGDPRRTVALRGEGFHPRTPNRPPSLRDPPPPTFTDPVKIRRGWRSQSKKSRGSSTERS